MAITSLVITTLPGTSEIVLEKVSAHQEIAEVQISHDPTRLVAVLEANADKIQDIIKNFKEIDNVLAVDIAYINYEDDIEREGTIPCPEHISKLKQT